MFHHLLLLMLKQQSDKLEIWRKRLWVGEVLCCVGLGLLVLVHYVLQQEVLQLLLLEVLLAVQQWDFQVLLLLPLVLRLLEAALLLRGALEWLVVQPLSQEVPGLAEQQLELLLEKKRGTK